MVQPNAEQSANTLIAQALENAGVAPKNIEAASKEVEQTTVAPVPTLDGEPKPATQGELPEEDVDGEPSGKQTLKSDEETPKPEPLGKADIEAAISEASSKFQSMMDGKINQLQFQMKQTVGALNQFFQSQEDTSISSLPAEEQVQARLTRLEKPAQPKIQIQSEQPINQQAT